MLFVRRALTGRGFHDRRREVGCTIEPGDFCGELALFDAELLIRVCNRPDCGRSRCSGEGAAARDVENPAIMGVVGATASRIRR